MTVLGENNLVSQKVLNFLLAKTNVSRENKLTCKLETNPIQSSFLDGSVLLSVTNDMESGHTTASLPACLMAKNHIAKELTADMSVFSGSYRTKLRENVPQHHTKSSLSV